MAQKSSFIFVATIAALAFSFSGDTATPYPPSAGGQAPVPVRIAEAAVKTPSSPVGVRIPSIGLDAPVKNVGVNAKGEMDVPSGKTNDVGWYQHGTLPGQVGSAVLDAHVFAAFKRLGEVKRGDDVYVEGENGSTLHFKVEEVRTYALKDVPRKLLFSRKDAKRLNLITCAGKPTKDRSTYTHRLIVYAVLVEEEQG